MWGNCHAAGLRRAPICAATHNPNPVARSSSTHKFFAPGGMLWSYRQNACSHTRRRRGTLSGPVLTSLVDEDQWYLDLSDTQPDQTPLQHCMQAARRARHLQVRWPAFLCSTCAASMRLLHGCACGPSVQAICFVCTHLCLTCDRRLWTSQGVRISPRNPRSQP